MSDPHNGSKYDVSLDGAHRGPVRPHEDGGWPTFSITLTYHVEDTDDIAKAQESAQAFFTEVDWPEGIDLA